MKTIANAYFIVTYGNQHKIWDFNYKNQNYEYLMNLIKMNNKEDINPNNLGFIISTEKCMNINNYKYNTDKIEQYARVDKNVINKYGNVVKYIFWANIKCYYCKQSAIYHKPILSCFKCSKNKSIIIKYPNIYI